MYNMAEGSPGMFNIRSDIGNAEITEVNILTKTYVTVEAATIYHFCTTVLRDVSDNALVTRYPKMGKHIDSLEIKYRQRKAHTTEKLLRELEKEMKSFTTVDLDYIIEEGVKIDKPECDTVNSGLHEIKVYLGKIKLTGRRHRQITDLETPNSANFNSTTRVMHEFDIDKHTLYNQNEPVCLGSTSRSQYLHPDNKALSATFGVSESVCGSDSFRELNTSGSNISRERNISGSESFRDPIISGSESFRDPIISGSESFREPNISGSESFRVQNMTGSDAFRNPNQLLSDPLRMRADLSSNDNSQSNDVNICKISVGKSDLLTDEHRYFIGSNVFVKVYEGSIDKMREVDAIVCPNDKFLMSRGYIARSIKNAGGQDYAEALTTIERKHCYTATTGDVFKCAAGNLRVKYVLHLVREGCSFTNRKETELYKTGITNVLKKANKNGLKKLAIPLCGTGDIQKNAKKLRLCCKAFAQAIRTFCSQERNHAIEEIHLVNNSETVCKALVKVLDEDLNSHS